MLVKFDDSSSLTACQKGDLRIELLVDGVLCGLRYLPEAKYKAKGMEFEFTGYRTGRKEERKFVFNCLPDMGVSQQAQNEIPKNLPNHALRWIEQMDAQGKKLPLPPLTGELLSRHSVDPPLPVGP